MQISYVPLPKKKDIFSMTKAFFVMWVGWYSALYGKASFNEPFLRGWLLSLLLYGLHTSWYYSVTKMSHWLPEIKTEIVEDICSWYNSTNAANDTCVISVEYLVFWRSECSVILNLYQNCYGTCTIICYWKMLSFLFSSWFKWEILRW